MSNNRLIKINGRDRWFICDVCQGKYSISQGVYVSDPNSQQYGFFVCQKDKDLVIDLRHKRENRDLEPPDPKLVRIEPTSQFETRDDTDMIDSGGYLSTGTAPAAPTNFYLISAEVGDASFGWSLSSVGSSSITGYRVERAVYNSDEFEDFVVVSTNTLDVDTTYVDTDIAASTMYVYRLKAINSYGSSSYSDEYIISLDDEESYLMAHYVRAGGSNTNVYKQATAPTASDSVLVGDLWIDTTSNTLKQATSITPVTWASSQNGATDLALTTPKITTGIKDANGNLIVGFTATASAVNYVNITDNSTTNGPIIASAGSDTNSSLSLQAKGNGKIRIQSLNSNVPVNFLNAAGTSALSYDVGSLTSNRTATWPDASGTVVLSGQSNTALTTPNITTGIKDSNGNLILEFSPVGTPVNYLTVTNSATSASLFVASNGTDTNINTTFYSKGTGASIFRSTTGNVPILFRNTGGTAAVSHDVSALSADRTVTWPDQAGRPVLQGFTSTATAAGTTTLTVASTRIQYFTGSTTQTCTLPVVTTLYNGCEFVIGNQSSGNVTVQTSGGNTLATLTNLQEATVRVINTGGGTGTASWSHKVATLSS